MRALGVDPGTVVTGYGIVDEEGNQLFHVSSGTIQFSPKSEICNRLQQIYIEIEKIIQANRPDAVVIEKGFYSKNVQALVRLSQVNGVIMLTSVNAGIPMLDYTPLEVKQSIVGYGEAKKEQVQHMVGKILRLVEPPTPLHASDALAIAICYLNSYKFRELR